jgi:hypothetical protein
MVYGPMKALCPLSLPEEIRVLAANKLESIKPQHARRKDIDQIIHSLRAGTSFSCSAQDFLAVTNQFDSRRGTSLIKTFPEWNRILNGK